MPNHSLLVRDTLGKAPIDKHKRKGKKHKLQNSTMSHKQVSGKAKGTWNELLELENKHRVDNVANDKNQDGFNEDNFFCNLPTSSYARVVIGADSREINLWSTEGVLAQCHIDGVLRANTRFESLCQTQVEHSAKCCRSWSPANYIALLSNRSSCLQVTETDLSRVKALLEQCAYYYHDRQLSADCAEDPNCQEQVPSVCYMKNAAYHLLHYLLDANFIPPMNHVRTCLSCHEQYRMNVHDQCTYLTISDQDFDSNFICGCIVTEGQHRQQAKFDAAIRDVISSSCGEFRDFRFL